MIEISILGPGDQAKLENVEPDVFDLPVRDDLIREFLDDPRHHIAVATHQGRIVGFASAVHYIHPDKEAELWINEVGVAPDHQGRGLGKQLMRTLLQLARELGCREAWVLTERENKNAIKLYESVGGRESTSETVTFSFPIADARASEAERPPV